MYAMEVRKGRHVERMGAINLADEERAMASQQRIMKNLGATFAGKIISILQQIVVPAVFVTRYGLSGFGEWMALSGAVAALGTLNFGVQTYMNQDLAIRFNRGEMEGYRVRQSTALRLLGGVVLVAAVLLLGFFAVPFDRLLRLDLTRVQAQVTLYLLALQVLLAILFGYFGGIFMGVNRAHRGSNWNNAQALVSAVGLLVGVVLHAPFAVLAAIQLGALVVCMAGVLVDLRRTAPEVFPTLAHWDGAAIPEMLRGSGYFGLLEMSTFLTYQAPLLILQRLLGPVAVAAFTFMRTIFSMCRQVLAMLTQAMGAEITTLYGQRDWLRLAKLYSLSERGIFFLIAVVNTTVLVASPVLIAVWIGMRPHGGLGTTSLFAVTPYVLASAISMVVSLKEHKLQFQFSTNTHESMARAVFAVYAAMVVVSVGTIRLAGVEGFLWTWLAAEVLLTVRLIVLNARLFAGVFAKAERIDMRYVTRLALLCVGCLAVAAWGLPWTSRWLWLEQACMTALVAVVVGTLAWRAFGVGMVYRSFAERRRSV